MSAATVAKWAANLLVAVTFLTLVQVLGRPGTLWLHALVGVGCWVLVYFLVPETKDTTLEQIEERWRETPEPTKLHR